MKIWKYVVAGLAAVVVTAGAAVGEDLSPNAQKFLNATGLTYGVHGANAASGEFFADVMQSSLTMQRAFTSAMPSIINYSQTAHTQVSDTVLASSVCPTSMCAPNNKWVMWDTPFLVYEGKRRDGRYLGYDQNASGFATGISRMFDETTALGLAVGYDYRKMDGRDHYHLRERADAFHAALYGGTAVAWFFIDGYAGYSRSWHRTERLVDTGAGTADRNKGNFNDTILSAGLKASYVCILPNEVRITPAIGLDYSHVRLGSLTEKGWAETGGVPGGMGTSTTTLRTNASTYHNLQMPVTVSVNKTYCANFLSFRGTPSLWTPEVRGGFVPQFGPKRTGVRTRLASGGDSWKVRSTEIGNYGTVGAGLKIKLADKYIFAVDYNYAFAKKYNNHMVTGTYGVSF
ncbi:MAG: autotransporter outer membrane beta-barrel domain-containing protein [Planctomycetes bacterium]|nr:autotransporter outer membrane beta-barrel domain-containing protein [Planctomycetota bacterium]